MELSKISKILSQTINVSTYLNNPANKKFKNFLDSKSIEEQPWNSCSKDIEALEMYDETITINNQKCIGCLNCITSNEEFVGLDEDLKIELWNLFFQDGNWTRMKIESNNIFNGTRIQLPIYNTLIRNYSGFEDYTAINEVGHISLWGLSTLKFLSSIKSISGKEIEIHLEELPRDGRLDICLKCNNKVLIVETKRNFETLINDKKFIHQISKYKIGCQKIIADEFGSDDLNLQFLFLIGGCETDLFPPTHSDCTSTVGDKSFNFYNDMDKNKIQFISANALWVLGTNAIFSNQKICWDLLFPKIFSNENVMGLVTSGIIVKNGSEYEIQPISKKIIDATKIIH